MKLRLSENRFVCLILREVTRYLYFNQLLKGQDSLFICFLALFIQYRNINTLTTIFISSTLVLSKRDFNYLVLGTQAKHI